MSAASVGVNLLQDMSEPVFEMKFESLSPTSKVAYRLVDKETLYGQLSQCGYPAITDTSIIRATVESRAEINYRSLTEVNYGLR